MHTVRSSWRWFLLIVLAILAAYWKLAFPNEFSLLTGYESANQAYAWNHFFASSIQHGSLPLWDPYGQSGRTLIGETQSGMFYPPKLLLYLWPFNSTGHLAPRLYHWFYLLSAVFGAWFMFKLARDIGLRDFAAYFAAITFVVGGFVGRIVWPHLHDGAIWLPLVLFFAGRALRARQWQPSMQYACAAGLALGMTLLSGALHLAIMQSMAMAGLIAYFSLRKECPRARATVILAVIGAIGVAASAVQILPSLEYAPLAFRFLEANTTLPSAERIPYGYLNNNFLPRALFGFLAGYPFAGANIGTEEIYPYLGILPLLAAMAGVWRNWANAWVRYLAVLAVLAFDYSLGDYSLLHGVLYAVVPRLWMAREPGRFVYLVHFALALLAGFGVQTLFESENVREIFRRPLQALGWIVAAVAAILTIPVLTTVKAPEWSYLAFLQILMAFCLLLAVVRNGWRGWGARFLLVALTLSDLSVINLTIRDTKTMPAAENHLQILFDSEAVCNFLKSQRGLFRVHILAPAPSRRSSPPDSAAPSRRSSPPDSPAPSIGEVYGVYTTAGMAATSLRDYQLFMSIGFRATEMLGVRYYLRPASSDEPGYVYADKLWKVYETGKPYFPRAWMVGRVFVEPERLRAFSRLAAAEFDPATMALSADPLDSPPSTTAAIPAAISWDKFDINRIEMTVRTPSPGLLVVAEMYYPGWYATVDGRDAPIHKVDNVFRGVVLPAGESRVVFVYRPMSVYAGGVITLLCFAGVIGWCVVRRPRESRLS